MLKIPFHKDASTPGAVLPNLSGSELALTFRWWKTGVSGIDWRRLSPLWNAKQEDVNG